MPCVRFALAALLLLAFLAGPGAATAPAGDEPKVMLAIGTEGVPIEDFLVAIGRATAVPLVWDPEDRAIRGRKIHGSANLEVSSSRLWDQARALLFHYGLVIVPVGSTEYQLEQVVGLDRLHPGDIPPRYVRVDPASLSTWDAAEGLYVSATIPLNHVTDAEAVRAEVIEVLTTGDLGRATVVPGGHALVVTDFAPRVARAFRLVSTLDAPRVTPPVPERQTIAIDLDHVDAKTAAALLEHQFVSQGTGGEHGESADVSGPHIVAVPSRRRILVTGTAMQREAVKSAAGLLDLPQPASTVRVVVLRPTNLAASGAAQMLRTLFDSSPALVGEGAERPVVLTFGDALVVAADPQALARIQSLLAELDKPAR